MNHVHIHHMLGASIGDEPCTHTHMLGASIGDEPCTHTSLLPHKWTELKYINISHGHFKPPCKTLIIDDFKLVASTSSQKKRSTSTFKWY